MNAATGDLDLVEQFLNTLDERTFLRHGDQHVAADELASVDALSAWLEAHGGTPDTGLSQSDLDTALSLRAALRGALLATPQAAPALAGFSLHLTPDPAGRLRLTAASGVTGLDVILETVAAAVAAGRWHRLKLCASPDCRWAFHDTSRSGGGRWCSMEVCGNRHKTRAYRRRRQED
ncbi:CGNR zinc finger domain-containing protein [Paractinoplanes maris]|uniref:CGNR zinc finger domain-containing protein n=1 Tax=Paractinoplanes maris TaxID=1734446 RepID=UPI002021DE68|nr:CGNR zinc finger domain-containing protein [Actinoplanes maris]